MNEWRLPTIKELLSVVDYSLYAPATKEPGFESDVYWSATKHKPNSALIWILDMNDGSCRIVLSTAHVCVKYVRTLEDGSLEWGALISFYRWVTHKEAVDLCEEQNRILG